MRTAEQMRATLQACHEAGDHSEALEVATDVTCDAERRRAELVGEMRDLAERLQQAADRLDEDGHVNGLGVVQHRGSEIDRLCAIYRTLVSSAERMQKAAGIDPNA
jgi:gamma-glutamyl:cysteine ligase YbdK (ATP-grasp superfamily)